MAQTINEVETQLALDRVGLPEVIATSNGDTYLHLPGLIVAESAAGERRYLLSDGLGSVRQAVDEMAAVVTYNEFDPYGSPVQNGGDPYGFTGEWWEDKVGLLYLRARWYMPEIGVFLSRDLVEGEPPYLYARGNPVKWTDPSGNIPLGPLCEGNCDPNNPCEGRCDPNNEEPTKWLINAMSRNTVGPMANLIRYYNFDYRLSGDNNLGGRIVGRIAGHKVAYDLWISMVRTGAPWDFKLPIRFKQEPEFGWGGEWVQMCCGWYSYENIANIHFGYVGRAVGFSAFELKAGAGVFQWRDHHGEKGYEERIDKGEVGLHTYYDEPEDQVGIQVGINFYDWQVPFNPEEFCYRVFNKFSRQLKRRPY